MGGLVLGLCLKKYAPDVDYDIYESAAELTEVGAGVGMSPRIWTIMQELGLEDELLTITGVQGQGGGAILRLVKGDEQELIDITQQNQLHTFHRSMLQQLLAKHLDAGDKIHFSKRLVSYSEPASTVDPIVLNFKDGTTATCDLVIGSDGVRSAVRRTMFSTFADEAEKNGKTEEASKLRAMVEPVWTGEVAYRGLTPASALSEDLVKFTSSLQIFVGKNRDAVIYPVSGGKIINVLGVVYTPGSGTVYDGPWVETSTSDEVGKLFDGWEPKVLAVLKSVGHPLCWAMHTTRKLPTYVKGRAALIGDAAHAMLPHQGAGVGQAFEDGYILATILSHSSVKLSNAAEALKIYDDVRRPFSQNVQQGSEDNAKRYQLRTDDWEDVTLEDSKAGQYDHAKLDVLAKEFMHQMQWSFDSSILGDRDQVEEKLRVLSV
ncbi:FAD/NAD(P)-binding domain-containing protein [Dichomitus squalens]|uniref:FAD/NAD(P)-binding domain-containing protein n=1 Tax=Dichomitus squalens TaxID=114155 RepID=A0A4Q9NXB2_9APHY|nr:FAD/NAD(P)-binding domain-containing protein [Dichomitus squalens]TBU60249.1 FAD/NAD(P)-binding domain-containing protein [Dichomitus squalens]